MESTSSDDTEEEILEPEEEPCTSAEKRNTILLDEEFGYSDEDESGISNSIRPSTKWREMEENGKKICENFIFCQFSILNTETNWENYGK